MSVVLKKLLLITIPLLILVAGATYFFINNRKETIDSTPKTSDPNIQLSELPDTWLTYNSPEWGFAINYPPDIKTELTQNGVHFLKLGDTQSTGTELFDGLSLLIFTAPLTNTTFENFVQKEYLKIKNDPIYEEVSSLEKARVATFDGYSFSATGIGKSTVYFLPKGTEGYVKISDMTVEPGNTKRDFHATVSQMLNTFQLTSGTTSVDNAPPGSLHNLPVPKAVEATKEFAAQDFNVPVGSVIVMSAFEKEWSNGCLGLEQPGEMCTEAITPGYEITIQANSKTRIYRTNSDGSLIKIQQ